jgi:hypothetical protein
VDVTDNGIYTASTSTRGTILGHTAESLIAGKPDYGFYGINVYDAGTSYVSGGSSTPMTNQYGTCALDFRMIRYTSLDNILKYGVYDRPVDYDEELPKAPVDTGTLMGDVLYNKVADQQTGTDIHQRRRTRTVDNKTVDELMYLAYDSEQGVFLDLDEYFTQLTTAITATGKKSGSGFEHTLVKDTESTRNIVREIKFESHKGKMLGTSDPFQIDPEGNCNLNWMGADGFRVRKSDQYNEWTAVQTTYQLADERHLETGKYWPLNLVTYIPVNVDLQLTVGSKSWLKEGENLGDQGKLAQEPWDWLDEAAVNQKLLEYGYKFYSGPGAKENDTLILEVYPGEGVWDHYLDNGEDFDYREGKYHQVKRMLAACGTPVLTLRRLSVGALVLDKMLSPGGYRELTEPEIGAVFMDAVPEN